MALSLKFPKMQPSKTMKIAVVDNVTVVWRLIPEEPWEYPRIPYTSIKYRVIGLHFCRW